ncbi:hypothetical protein Tsubulata_051098, partial [Turnera subulata]
VSVFSCGGMALGYSFLHKLVDAGATKGFTDTWTHMCRGGDINGVVPPALSEPSHFFPPTPSFPQKYLSVIENVWFTNAKFITRRFAFDSKAIASLKAKAANGNPKAKISRIETLSCFLWKCFTSASKALSPDSPKPSVIAEAVNFRPRTKPPMSDISIGNNFWWAIAIAHPSDDNTELHELVNRLNEAIALYDTEYMQSLQGEEDLSAPILVCQVTVFSCGGIALGLSCSHKLIDGGTGKGLGETWSSLSRGDASGVSIWFAEGNYITRRFVFDAKAIASLKEKAANGNPVVKTSRIETLSCFIWKCCMSATKALGSPKSSILVEAVNLRHRTKPPMSAASIGNNFWWAIAMAQPTDEKTEMHDLLNLLNEAIALYDTDYTHSLQGEEGADAMGEIHGYSHVRCKAVGTFTRFAGGGQQSTKR